MAKGPLVSDHLILCPVEHVAKPGEITEDMHNEMEVYQQSLIKCFAASGNEMLLWERHLPTKGVSHTHYQLLPVASRHVEAATELLLDEGKKNGLSFQKMDRGATPNQMVGDLPFIRFRFGNEASFYIAKVDPSADMRPLFPLVRRAVAVAIGQPARSNWKRCLTSKQEESLMVEGAKERFAKFEPDFESDDDDD
eukprot:CAMPEP_0197531750 /NCGR_PEP_ID=MMETSP1318-20131121/36978_1 /TAXON_ID=552666 /ORGANISM="Partenskyella glossopodia, Strain RCC365" /LENGTH=194 /DNA_ID=CAMNT_0043088079 /DNA_START=42 /DNA_END=626 /DNA_ORIENTATION=-